MKRPQGSNQCKNGGINVAELRTLCYFGEDNSLNSSVTEFNSLNKY